MFSPLENEELDHWFQRLNAPLKSLPANERRELHAEVRQHLEALAVANEELGSTPEEAWQFALDQFGDPGKFGRHMAWEWWRTRHQLSPDMVAFLFGARVHFASLTGVMGLALVKLFTPLGEYFPTGGIVFDLAYSIGVPVITGFAIGRRCPYQALRGSFSTSLTLMFLPLFLAALAAPTMIVVGDRAYPSVCYFPVAYTGWLLMTCGAAYLASVTRRGWYQPSLADFKITLPQRRRQVR